MSTVKSKKLQVGTDATSSNNFTIYQPATPDGTLRVGVGNSDSPTEVGRFDSNGYVPSKTPAFAAYNNSDQIISSTSWTKIIFPLETLDTESCYDTTNSRFTPTVKGIYMITARIGHRPVTSSYFIPNLYLNGSQYQRGIQTNPNGNYGASGGTWVVELNGTTDYAEIYCYSATGFTTESGAAIVWWSGTLINRT